MRTAEIENEKPKKYENKTKNVLKRLHFDKEILSVIVISKERDSV